MKRFYLILAICTLVLGANAQIGTGLINKAKSTVGKEKKEDKKEGTTKSNDAAPESKTTKEEIAKPKAECIPYFKEGDAKYKKR